jgi:ubiquinone/menaquinone biosynthesis C-methylase UbiE
MDFANPEENLKQFGVSEGMRIADLGAGTGAYSFAAAELVGTTGGVFAVEVQKDLVERVQAEARERGFMNIEVRWGDIEVSGGTKLRDNSVDAVVLSNILFQLEDREGLVREVKRILRPGGRILVIDWSDSYDNLGPAEEAVITEPDARSFFEQKGFVFEEKIAAGAHHYGFSMAMK